MMQCPKCGSYTTEKEIQKTDVKYAPGNVIIEYTAQCPHCHVEMGRVSWGQLTVNPDIERMIAEEKRAATREHAHREIHDAEPPAPASDSKLCPHCGKPLPADY